MARYRFEKGLAHLRATNFTFTEEKGNRICIQILLVLIVAR